MFGNKTKKKAAWVQSALERYERPLLQYAMSIVGEIERARDIVQETFMRLHNQEQEAIEGHLSQWLFTVCRNCALKSLKKEDRYIYVEAQEFEQKKCESLTPLMELERKERIQRLMELVKELPKNQHEVVRLRSYHHHSYQEISEITGLSVGNVGFLLNAAMRNLRGKLDRDDKDEKIIYLTKGVAKTMRGKFSDQDLTDYALNEMKPEERLYIESMLACSEECRHDVTTMIEMAQMLEQSFDAEDESLAPLELTPQQRASLLEVKESPRWIPATATGLAAAACATFAFMHPGFWQAKGPAVQVAKEVSTNVSTYVADAVNTTVSAVNPTEDDGAVKLGTFQKLAEDPALKKWFSTDWLAPEFSTPQGPWAQPPATWEPMPQALLDMP